jgi:predicted DNA-binding transcriptional regulator YafY
MTKSKRLMELMIAVNKRRKFTVRELSEEFGVSTRTIMRDLQVLDELGLPLYAEYGPHGGYRVLNERMLPPIMFSEQEALAMFFAYQSLEHYGDLPFDKEAAAALMKFYYYLPDDTKQTIDRMKDRVVFWTPKRDGAVPHLKLLLEAALEGKALRIVYDSRDGAKSRMMQPIGVYSYKGYWYCPAYCFLRSKPLLFRVDRVLEAQWSEEEGRTYDISKLSIQEWLNPSAQHNKGSELANPERLRLKIQLTSNGVRRCQWEGWEHEELQLHEDGSGTLFLHIQRADLEFYTSYVFGLGADAVVREPVEMVDRIKAELSRLTAAYDLDTTRQ